MVIIKVIDVNDNVKLVITDIPEPSERASRFKKRKCSRCDREFHPTVGTQPTCGACYYELKCAYCGEWFKPKPAKVTRVEQTEGKNYCCKAHGDKDKMHSVNRVKSDVSIKRKSLTKEKLKEKEYEIKENVKLVLYSIDSAKIKSVFKESVCTRCGREYYPNSTKQKCCGCCAFVVECSICGKHLEHKAATKEEIESIDEFYCGDCSRVNVMHTLWKDPEFADKVKSYLLKGSEIKFCEECGKETHHVGDRCRVCDPWEKGGASFGFKYCEECQEVTNHVGDRCYVCDPWEIKGGQFGYKYCVSCSQETFHAGDRCYECDPWENKGGFNREAFYSDKLELIKFESVDKSITLEDIDSLKGVPGVWSKETTDGEVLDVSETKDIGKEISFSVRAFKANAGKTDEELNALNNSSLRKKYRDIYEYAEGEVVFKVIAEGVEDKETRQAIEAQYAHDKKAVFWSPAPGQSIYVD